MPLRWVEELITGGPGVVETGADEPVLRNARSGVHGGNDPTEEALTHSGHRLVQTCRANTREGIHRVSFHDRVGNEFGNYERGSTLSAVPTIVRICFFIVKTSKIDMSCGAWSVIARRLIRPG